MHTKYKGILGEFIASICLMLKGFHIEERRFKTHCGEIDLIASKGNLLVFVEVKSRKHMDECFTAIRNKQLCRIQRASQIFLKKRPRFMAHQIRFDAIFVANWHLPVHLENVYILGM